MSTKNNVLFLLYMLFGTGFASTNLHCDNTVGNSTENSLFVKNRDDLLFSLAPKVVENNGFYNTTVGEGPDKVYAIAFCRADPYDYMGCESCIKTAAESLKVECPVQEKAIVWTGRPPCLIRYANHSFVGTLELLPFDSGCAQSNLSLSTAQLDLWENLMEVVIGKASASTNSRKNATGDTKLASNLTVYTIMQCTPDISESQCSYCLSQSVTYIRANGNRSNWCYVQRPNCVWRWDFYPFYLDGPPVPNVSSPAPNSTVSTHKRKSDKSWVKFVAIIVPIVAVILLFIAGYILLARRRRKKHTYMQQDKLVRKEPFDD